MIKNTSKVLLLAAAVVGTASQAFASTSASTSSFSDTIVSLSEISVTKIKSTSRQSFPVSQTVISAEEIFRYDINGLKGTSELAPNFYMPAYGSRMTSTIYVRGLGTRMEQPVVGLTVDNVPLMNKDLFDFDILDIESVEVVRGPQSTMFGRNTMGGMINITTLSPLKYSGVRAIAEYGSGNTWRLGASAYQKVSPTFGLALAAAYNSTDGFFINEYNGRKADKEHQGLVRLKAGWKPSRHFILENTAWINMTRQGGYPYSSLESGIISYNDTCYYKRTSIFDGLTMSWLGNNFSISSITGFQYFDADMTIDNDFLPESYFTLSQRTHEWSFTQDFVAKGNAGAYNWLGGIFGFYRHNKMDAPVNMKEDGIERFIEGPANAGMANAGMQIGWDERSMLLSSRFHSPLWGLAAYHKSEVTFGNLKASVGLRLAYERINFNYNSKVDTRYTLYRMAGPNLIPLMTNDINIDNSDDLHQTSLQLLPEFKIGYTFSNAFSLGAVVSKGYKSGGYNTQMFSDILQQQLRPGGASGDSSYDVDDIISYKPETSWNYEIDARLNVSDINLNLDAALFYIDVRNQQMTVFPDGNTTGRMMTNAGRSRSIGMELTATYRPRTDLIFIGSYGLADARLTKYNDGLVDYKGKHVPYAPENTMFLSATYSPAIHHSFLTGIDFTVDCRGVGRIYWNEENTEKQNFYATLGASVTLKSKMFDLELWSRNMTDTKYAVFYFESIGNRFVQRGNPTTTGVTLRFHLD